MIPIKIKTLLEGQVAEENRVEYKEGWNLGDRYIFKKQSEKKIAIDKTMK